MPKPPRFARAGKAFNLLFARVSCWHEAADPECPPYGRFRPKADVARATDFGSDRPKCDTQRWHEMHPYVVLLLYVDEKVQETFHHDPEGSTPSRQGLASQPEASLACGGGNTALEA